MPCQQKRAARLPSAAPGSIKEGGGQTKCCAWQHQGRGGLRNALGYRPEPEVLPLPAETSREAAKCCAGSIKGGGPETRSGTVQSLKCCAETSREAPKCCAWQHQGGGGPNQVLRLAASREGGPRNALLYRNQPRGSQVLRLAASRERGLAASRGGGPETRSGTVQSLKCCPCQQKRAARLPSAAPAASRGGPRNALGHRPEPEVLPLPAETSREAAKCCAWQHQGKKPRNALGYRPEPEVLPLPAETSREAPKCCAWQHQGGGGPRNALGHRPEPEVCVSESTWVCLVCV